MATRSEVIVIDVVKRSLVSRFQPKDPRRPNANIIKALQASGSGPVLLIGMTEKHYHDFTARLFYHYPSAPYRGFVSQFSALTGALIALVCEVKWTHKFHIELTHDEQRMVLWKHDKVYVYDMRDVLTCMKGDKIAKGADVVD